MASHKSQIQFSTWRNTTGWKISSGGKKVRSDHPDSIGNKLRCESLMTVAPRHVLPCNGWCCNPWKISPAEFFRRPWLAITLLLDSWLGITTENWVSRYKDLAYLGLDNSFLFLPRSLSGDVCGHYSNGKATQPVDTCWAKCFLIWTISIPQHMCHYHNRHHHYHCHHR